MTINAASERVAKRARGSVALITNVTGVLLLVVIAVIHGGGVIDAVGSFAIATQVVFIGAVSVTAHLFGTGLPPEQRSVLTLGVSSRNLGAALVPLATIDPDPRAVVMIAIAAPVTLVLSAVTARWLARRNRALSVAFTAGSA
jgi:BASS family bile acid:Na+ symporter